MITSKNIGILLDFIKNSKKNNDLYLFHTTKIVDDNNNLKFYYSDGELCMYSKSPCSNLSISNIERKKIKGYSVFYIKKN